MPDRSLWSGEAGLVIAKTIDGDIGVQTGHSPVFGILSPGSVVRIREVPGDESPGDVVRAAVRDGFLSVTDEPGVDPRLVGRARRRGGRPGGPAPTWTPPPTAAGSAAAAEESPEVRYARARLRAAGEQA